MFDKDISKVQLWNNGLMITLIPKIEAEEMVNKGGWKVINGVAITPI